MSERFVKIRQRATDPEPRQRGNQFSKKFTTNHTKRTADLRSDGTATNPHSDVFGKTLMLFNRAQRVKVPLLILLNFMEFEG